MILGKDDQLQHKKGCVFDLHQTHNLFTKNFFDFRGFQIMKTPDPTAKNSQQNTTDTIISQRIVFFNTKYR